MIRKTPQQVIDALRAGDPPILIAPSPAGLMFSPQCVEMDEVAIIVRRLREELQ